MAAMTDEMRQIVAALDDGKAYERRERERRIGAWYVALGGLVLALAAHQVVLVVPALWTAVRETGWWQEYAFAGPAVVVAVGLLLRQRWFRHLRVRARDVWGLSPWAIVALLSLFGLGAMLLALMHLPSLTWPLVLLTAAAFFAAQGWPARDRTHLAFAAGLGGLAAAFAAFPLGAHAILGAMVAIGASLVGIGLSRMRRAAGGVA